MNDQLINYETLLYESGNKGYGESHQKSAICIRGSLYLNMT